MASSIDNNVRRIPRPPRRRRRRSQRPVVPSINVRVGVDLRTGSASVTESSNLSNYLQQFIRFCYDNSPVIRADIIGPSPLRLHYERFNRSIKFYSARPRRHSFVRLARGPNVFATCDFKVKSTFKFPSAVTQSTRILQSLNVYLLLPSSLISCQYYF